MTGTLLRLPVVEVADASEVQAFGGLLTALSRSWVVLVGTFRTTSGGVLDEFCMAAALAAHCPSAHLGVVTPVGGGRAHGLIAREATTAQLLGACETVLLEGTPSVCRDAATIVTALFNGGSHTMTTASGAVHDAVNDPLPSVPGGPPVLWREGHQLWRMVDGGAVLAGAVLDLAPGDRLPSPALASLVVMDRGGVSVSELRATLAA